MENRDRDKLSKNIGSKPVDDVNRSTEDIRSSGSTGSSGMKGDIGRSSGSSDLGDVDRGDMGSKKPDMDSKKPNRSDSSKESL